MAILKKNLCIAVSLFGLIGANFSFADAGITLPIEQNEANTFAIRKAANDFGYVMKRMLGGEVQLKSINYESTETAQNNFVVTAGNPQYLENINLNNVTLEVTGNSFFLGDFDITMTLVMNAHVGSNCTVDNNQNNKFTVVDITSKYKGYQSFLTYTLQQYGPSIVNDFIANNTNIKANYCH